MKAAQYDYDANKTNVHNLVQNCRGLDDSELCNFAGRLENLVGVHPYHIFSEDNTRCFSIENMDSTHVK